MDDGCGSAALLELRRRVRFESMALEPQPAHLAEAEARQIAIVRAMSPTQRLQRALAMNRWMRELLATGFRCRHPEWTEAQVRRAVADRILYARTG